MDQTERIAMRCIKEMEASLDDMVLALRNGQTIVYPTETCYGLGCDATNAVAVKRVYELKQRPKEKSLILIVSDLSVMAPYIEVTEPLKKIGDQYWPGPLTVIVSVNTNCTLPIGVVRDDVTIAFRVSSHPLAQALCQALGRPLVSTSANLAGAPVPYTVEAILHAWPATGWQPDIVIDAGILPARAPSTVIRLTGKNIELVRQGDIVVDL